MEFVGIDKFSLLDYEDKVSCVLFCKPCNFRCPFCHNGTTVLEAETFIPFEDILDYLKSRKGLIDAVVVSGGEPTLMPDLKEKIIKLKELGFLVKLDTNGTNPDIVKDLYPAFKACFRNTCSFLCSRSLERLFGCLDVYQ